MSPALTKAMGGARAPGQLPKKPIGSGQMQMKPQQRAQDIQADQVPQQLMNPPAPHLNSQQMPTLSHQNDQIM